MFYVLNKDGVPLMPTARRGKVRRMLKTGQAKVAKRRLFTIQLLYNTTDYTQPVHLGVDAGSKHIGVSATMKKEELYAADVELRTDIVRLLATRRARRSRKTRYRKARFQNRISSKKAGWLALSIWQKIQCHLQVVKNVHKILPITKIIVETASFDSQKIKNPQIQSKDYQQGEQLDFQNVREYVLFRDNHTCQCCKEKSKDAILNVHHIESRKTGGDAPNNLITLCETCYTGYHKGTVALPKTMKRGMSFRDAAFMGIMRWAFYGELKKLYQNTSMTYGYITKNTRIRNNLPKEYYVDARCISGALLTEPLGYYSYQKKVRRHNRQIHKSTILKGGIRKRNQADYLVKGFRLFDKVTYNGAFYFIFGRRKSGFFDIRNLNGEQVNKGNVNCKKIILVEKAKSYLTETRKQTA